LLTPEDLGVITSIYKDVSASEGALDNNEQNALSPKVVVEFFIQENTPITHFPKGSASRFRR
jgi:hypothetical protein